MNSPISPELPNDCWGEVFKHFDSPADFSKVATVSKRFHKMVNQGLQQIKFDNIH